MLLWWIRSPLLFSWSHAGLSQSCSALGHNSYPIFLFLCPLTGAYASTLYPASFPGIIPNKWLTFLTPSSWCLLPRESNYICSQHHIDPPACTYSYIVILHPCDYGWNVHTPVESQPIFLGTGSHPLSCSLGQCSRDSLFSLLYCFSLYCIIPINIQAGRKMYYI